jgi:hypothetical protein
MFRVNSTLPAPMIVTFAMLGSVAGGPETHNIARRLGMLATVGGGLLAGITPHREILAAAA